MQTNKVASFQAALLSHIHYHKCQQCGVYFIPNQEISSLLRNLLCSNECWDAYVDAYADR